MPDEPTISEKCETLYNKLNSFVTSVISRDVTPKISNLNTEVWGSDTQTGNSRIDTLNTNFNNLDSSITSMESDINNVESDVSNLQTSVNSLNTSITNNVNTIYTSSATCNSNLNFASTTVIMYRRVGKIVTLRLWSTQASPTRTGWINIASIPTGYKPIEDVPIAIPVINNSHIVQARTRGTNTVECYVASAGTESVGLTATWFTNDDYPSQ